MEPTFIPAAVPTRQTPPTHPSPITLVPNPNAADGQATQGVIASGLGADAVDAILAACVTDGQSGFYADLSGCAVPSRAGLDSKADLEALNWTVIVAS